MLLLVTPFLCNYFLLPPSLTKKIPNSLVCFLCGRRQCIPICQKGQKTEGKRRMVKCHGGIPHWCQKKTEAVDLLKAQPLGATTSSLLIRIASFFTLLLTQGKKPLWILLRWLKRLLIITTCPCQYAALIVQWSSVHGVYGSNAPVWTPPKNF